MALNEQAMLANLSISQWEARKFDKAATAEVAKTHGASNAGRYNKLLIDDTALAPIAKIATAMRLHHYKVTLPWGDNGDRLLPSRLYFDYTRAMRGFKQDFIREVDSFVAAYPTLRQAARTRLGTLYDPGDYPDVRDVPRRFNAEVSFMPVPDAKDFRVDVATEDADRIRADIAKKITERSAAAANDSFERAEVFVKRIRDTLKAEKPRIFDSLMDNLEELIKMLPAFNILDDAKLTELEQCLKAMHRVPAQLRARPEVREKVLKLAEDAVLKFNWA